jgi:hypothetical protein
MYLLLVTWLTYNQPPASYQTQFSSEAACSAARDKLMVEGAHLTEAQLRAGMVPTWVTRVVAVCSAQ